MNDPRSHSSSFLTDGNDRLLAGIFAEAKAKLAKLSEKAMPAEEKIAASREIERETTELITKLSSPLNYY